MNGLTRDRTLTSRVLKQVGDQIFTTEDCTIRIPYNYLKYKMAEIGDKIFILTVAVVIVGDRYGVLNGCCKVQISPASTKQLVENGVEYLEFTFNAGDVVCPTTLFVIDSDLIADMYKYFITNGRIPWFLDQEDAGRLFTYHRTYGGLNIAPNNIPFETVVSFIFRDPDNKFTYYRHTDMKKIPAVITFSSVLFNASSATAKLLGSNLADGFLAAIANPSESSNEIENILRS